MSNHDYRALCAELVAAFEIQLDELRFNNRLCIRARAALAQPEPEAPTDEELLMLMPETMRDEFSYAAKTCSDAMGGRVKPGIFRVALNTAALEYARAVLARCGTANNAINQEELMTAPNHITPSPKLVTSLRNSAPHGIRDAGVTRELWLINHAYAAGADQELEACCEWLHWQNLATHSELIPSLRAARRPKPPSLKEEAMQALCRFTAGEGHDGCTEEEIEDDFKTIRRALEALDD